MTIDVQAELAALPPVELPTSAADAATEPSGARGVSAALGKLARQQFRANQQAEHALEQLRAQLEDLRTTADDRRREVQRLRDDARDTRLRVAEALDALDDLMVIARQRQDPFWIARLERLAGRFTDALASVGVTELPGVGSAFDEYLHEVLETTDAAGAVPPHTVVELVRRGFRHDGAVLRRAQVITAK